MALRRSGGSGRSAHRRVTMRVCCCELHVATFAVLPRRQSSKMPDTRDSNWFRLGTKFEPVGQIPQRERHRAGCAKGSRCARRLLDSSEHRDRLRSGVWVEYPDRVQIAARHGAGDDAGAIPRTRFADDRTRSREKRRHVEAGSAGDVQLKAVVPVWPLQGDRRCSAARHNHVGAVETGNPAV